jgi:ribosomal protein S18 acetylase RimI-like enzyme
MSDDQHLTTGWEPDAPPGDTALRAFVLTMSERVERGATAVEGRAVRTDAAVFVDAASDCPFDNAVMLLRPPVEVDLDAVLAQADDLMPTDEQWLVVSAWPLPPPPSAPGWSLVGHPPFMVRAAGGAAPPPPDGLRVVEVGDDTARADFAKVLCEGFPVLGAGVMGDPRFRSPALRLYVGYEGERAVAVAGAYSSHGVTEVHSVATLPDARGRGYGEALTWAATVPDPSLPAVLLSSDPGRPVYERMGYLAVSRFTLWMRAPR